VTAAAFGGRLDELEHLHDLFGGRPAVVDDLLGTVTAERPR
jgi:hypothetical protein